MWILGLREEAGENFETCLQNQIFKGKDSKLHWFKILCPSWAGWENFLYIGDDGILAAVTLVTASKDIQIKN